MASDSEYRSFPAIAVWNVVFMAGPREHWWDWFTKPDWRHVCAFAYSVTADKWVIYDVADRTSRLTLVDNDWLDRWLACRKDKITAIVRMHTQEGGDVRARLGLWCVTAIKHLVGIRSGALRPQALHRDLLRHGASPAFEKVYGRQSESSQGRSGNQSPPRAG